MPNDIPNALYLAWYTLIGAIVTGVFTFIGVLAKAIYEARSGDEKEAGAQKVGAEAQKAEAEAKRIEAEANRIAMETVLASIEPLRTDLRNVKNELKQWRAEAKELRKENRELEDRLSSLEYNDRTNQKEIARLIKGINILIAQIERHDSKPDWRPGDD